MKKVIPILLLALLPNPPANAQVADLVLDSRVVQGAQLLECSQTSAETNWSFKLHDEQIRVPQESLLRWGGWTLAAHPNPAVWLIDGSWLSGEITFHSNDTLSIENAWLDIPTIPLTAVRGIVFQPPHSFQHWMETMNWMESTQGSADWLRHVDGTVRTGIIRQWPQSSEDSRDTFDGEDRTLQISNLALRNATPQTQMQQVLRIAEIESVVISPQLIGPVPPSAPITLTLQDGSRLRCQQMVMDGPRLKFVLAAGLSVTSLDSRLVFLTGITGIVCHNETSRLAFLSDLEPANYRYVSDSTLSWKLGRDQDCLGHTLLGRDSHGQWIRVPKGIATHSRSQVAYRWDGKPANFLAQIARASGASGIVECKILLAKAGQLRVASSFRLDNTTEEAFVDVDLTDAQLLVLLTEPAELGSYGDHVLWLDARICRAID